MRLNALEYILSVFNIVSILSRVFAFTLTISHFGFSTFGGWVFIPLLEDAVYVDDFIFLVLSQNGEVVHEGIGDKYFDDNIPNNSSGSDDDALDVYFGVEGD